MSRTRLVPPLLVALLAFGVLSAPAQAAGGDAPTATAAAKKKCKKGTKAVKVRSKGKTRTVCRKPKSRKPAAKAPAGPAGPSVAEVEAIIRGQAQAGHETWLGPESIAVTFERPTQVMPMVMYNPYEADPLTATGKVEAWPVRAWTKIVNNKDTTPDDDTKYGGCLAHLNSFFPYDSLYMFFRGQSGEWTFLTSSAKPGDCG
jgi:hypothetical protein